MRDKGMRISAAVFVAVALIAGCAAAWFPSGKRDEGTFDVRYTLISQLTGEYWDDIAFGAQQKARELGVSLKCVTFEEVTTENYLAQLHYAGSADIDGLILSGGVRTAELVEAAQQLRAQGIPVVFTDVYYPDAGVNAYACSDNVEGGRLAAKALAEEMNGEAKVLIVAYSTIARTQIERMDGFREALKAYPQMEVVDVIADKGDLYTLQKEVERVMAEHPEIDAIFSCGASGSESLGKCPTIRDRLGKSIRVVAFDMSENIAYYIEEGLYAATIAQDTRQMGASAVSTLEACRLGEQIDGQLIYTDLTIVTRENLEKHRLSGEGSVAWNRY